MGFEDRPSATALLGMDGFVLVAAGVIDGELHQVVETTASVVGCSACGTRATSRGRREVKVRDMASADRAVVVVWRKRLWRCEDPDCDTKTWSEQVEAIAPRASLTRRARVDICAQVGRHGRSVASVAARYGLRWATAMGAVAEHGAPLVNDPERIGDVEQLGLDETAFQAANATTLRRWRTEILAHDATGASNGPTEGLNLLVKKIKRVGHGFRSFRNYRLRLLLHCGVAWEAPPARMRGRSPRLVA